MTDNTTHRGTCPECKQPSQHQYRPFCSKRCADIDLGRWLTGRYVIAGGNDADEDGDAGDPPAALTPSDEDDQN